MLAGECPVVLLPQVAGCGTPPSLPNTRTQPPPNINPGSPPFIPATATYTCAYCYNSTTILPGSFSPIQYTITRTCQNGQWTGEEHCSGESLAFRSFKVVAMGMFLQVEGFRRMSLNITKKGSQL